MPSSLVAALQRIQPRLPLGLLICLSALGGCTAFKPPQISYDSEVPSLPELPALADDRPRPLHVPPVWKAARGGKKGEAKEPIERIESANDAARVEPRKTGYFNAVTMMGFCMGKFDRSET